jgi:uncharacterized protein (DUF305 family)
VIHYPALFRQAVLLCSLVFASTAFAAGPAPKPSQRNFEVRFLTEMIDHHAMAVMMADMCLERSVHPELQAMCEQIREAQMEEIVTMQNWLSEWYGIEHEPEMTPGQQKQMEKLAALSGAAFEIEFMKAMIRHHWKAVVRASQCEDKAYHQELIDLCAQIVSTQLAEINQMGDWLCEWYGICHYHDGGEE